MISPADLQQINDLIDARLKAQRHENADHLDRGLLLQKLAASGAVDGSIPTWDSTDQFWKASVAYGVSAGMSRTTTQTLTDGMQAKVTFNTEDWETEADMVDTSNNRITVPETGVYLIQTKIDHGTGATRRRGVIFVDGSVTSASHEDDGNVGNAFATSFIMQLTANQYVEYQALHAGGSLTLHSVDSGSYMRVCKIG